VNLRAYTAQIDPCPEAAMTRACGFQLQPAREDFPESPGFRADSDPLEIWIGLFRLAPPVLFLFAWARLTVASYLHAHRKLLNLQNLVAVEANDALRGPVKIRAVTADSYERAMDIVLGADIVIPENETFESEQALVAAAGKA
jgi:hypothetical protein